MKNNNAKLSKAKSFDELLNAKYGQIGSTKRNAFEEEARTLHSPRSQYLI